MGTADRAHLIEILQAARSMASSIAAVPCDVAEKDAFTLRIALAHALGLVDQLAELTGAPASQTVSAMALLELPPAVEDELVH